MNATSPLATDSYATNRRPVASLWHTVGLLLILALITYGAARTHGTTTKAAPEANLVHLYLTVMAGEWALVVYVWRGIRRRGATLRELIGGNWGDVSAFGRNFAIAVLFWFVWEGSARAMHLLLGPSDTANVTAMLPQNSVQIVVWCMVSCTPGFVKKFFTAVTYNTNSRHGQAARLRQLQSRQSSSEPRMDTKERSRW